MPDIIVLRPSPDWPRFDLCESRAFLSGVGFDPDLVIDFAAVWDRTFTRDYRSVREAVKQLSLASYRAVAGATLVPLAAFVPGSCAPGDRILFADDDDWLSPGLFGALPAPGPETGPDGYRWGSLRIGLDFDPTAPGAPFCAARPLGEIVYTNNYALSGRGLVRAGVAGAGEHTAAQRTFGAADFQVEDCPLYLSCAVKHPCSTVAVRAQMAAGFREAPERFLERFQRALEEAVVPPEGSWVRPRLEALRTLFANIRPR